MGREPRPGGRVWEVRALGPLSPVGCKVLLIATKRGLGVGEGAVRRYRRFECPGKATPASSSHVKQLFVWGSLGWGRVLGKGPKPLASFLFLRKAEGCRGLLHSQAFYSTA